MPRPSLASTHSSKSHVEKASQWRRKLRSANQNGKERAATREDDRAALKTLERRGITKEERSRLREVVGIALSSQDTALSDVKSAAREKRTEALMELRAWYSDWADTARSVVARRDHLIRLGLAKRKSAKKAAADAPVTPADAPGGAR